MTGDIKTMQLYPRAERIYADLRAVGYADDTPVEVEVLNRFDQLHYHGTDALDAAIVASGILRDARVLEVGSGWGGCARFLAARSGAHVHAVELQADYHAVACDLTARAGLADQVHHEQADFLTWEAPKPGFDHVVSWLALFHIPQRRTYLRKLHDVLRPQGTLFVEDLYLRRAPARARADDFARHLFPNSLVPLPEYQDTLAAAGFDDAHYTDMTDDWTLFTAERLHAFVDNRTAYEAIHGAEGYQIIVTFYTKMAGYFADGLVGGLRCHARRGG